MKKGDRAIIMNQTLGNRIIEEGNATLIKKFPVKGGILEGFELEYWEVQFDGDPKGETVKRWVRPDKILKS
jgi:hypothetical protein